MLFYKTVVGLNSKLLCYLVAHWSPKLLWLWSCPEPSLQACICALFLSALSPVMHNQMERRKWNQIRVFQPEEWVIEDINP